MRLSDLIGGMSLDWFPTVGLLMFLLAFCVLVWRVLTTRREVMDRHASIPLSNEPVDPIERPRKGPADTSAVGTSPEIGGER